MDIFNSSREELNALLSAERSENRKKAEMIEDLKRKLKLQNFMLSELKKTHENHLKSIQTGTCHKQTNATQINVKFTEKSIQTEAAMAAKQTQTTQTAVKFVDCCTQMDVEISEKSIQNEELIHDQAKQIVGKANVESPTREMILKWIAHDHHFGIAAKYKCKDCTYSTNKKSSFNDHIVEFCQKEVEKNMKCPVCDQMHTYRILRIHLNHYAKGKCQPQGKHAKYSTIQHQAMLNQHKLEKNAFTINRN